jgi:hypothetical protein
MILMSYAAFSAAQAQASGYTITYRSGKLSPVHGLSGIRGAKRVIATWLVSELRRGCGFYGPEALASYTDGKNTLQSLLNKGYEYDPQDPPGLVLCITREGKVKSGSSFDIHLLTSDRVANHKAYEAYHSDDEGRSAIVDIITYKHPRQKTKVEDESDGGKFTISD